MYVYKCTYDKSVARTHCASEACLKRFTQDFKHKGSDIVTTGHLTVCLSRTRPCSWFGLRLECRSHKVLRQRMMMQPLRVSHERFLA